MIPYLDPDGLADSDNSEHFPLGEEASISTIEAEQDAVKAILHLMQKAHQGEKQALEYLRDIAIKTAKFLDDDANEMGLNGKARINWEELIQRSAQWPVVLPVERDYQSDFLKRINKLPFGDSLGYKLHKRGKRPPSREEDSPASVALLVKRSLDLCVRNITLDRRETFQIYSPPRPINLSIEVQDKILDLPEFNEQGLQQWKETALSFVKERHERAGTFGRSSLIPDSWREAAKRNSRGFMSHVKRTLWEGMDTICPHAGD